MKPKSCFALAFCRSFHSHLELVLYQEHVLCPRIATNAVITNEKKFVTDFPEKPAKAGPYFVVDRKLVQQFNTYFNWVIAQVHSSTKGFCHCRPSQFHAVSCRWRGAFRQHEEAPFLDWALHSRNCKGHDHACNFRLCTQNFQNWAASGTQVEAPLI